MPKCPDTLHIVQTLNLMDDTRHLGMGGWDLTATPGYKQTQVIYMTMDNIIYYPNNYTCRYELKNQFKILNFPRRDPVDFLGDGGPNWFSFNV